MPAARRPPGDGSDEQPLARADAGGRAISVAVLGAGIAGLATALLLARDGHRVTLVDRDQFIVGTPEAAVSWPRRGIPHFLQPHAFIPRGRAELKDHFPDVYAALLEAGAEDVDLRRKLPGAPEPGDEVLQYLAVRRPVLEWALRRAVEAEGGVEVRSDVRVTGLCTDGASVTGVETGGAVLDAELVVDALGRRTPTPAWLRSAGAPADLVELSDCGVVYYARYYRLRPGRALPDGPWLLSPRGDLGYLGYASFPGDNGTFGAILAVPSGVPEWRAFSDPAVFEAAVALIPSLASWADPEAVDPITDVMPMAGLQNSLRRFGPASPPGLAPVGDARSHTDPVLAHGLSFALIHARELAAALRAHADVGDAAGAYAEATEPALRERYELATALDDQRYRLWTGEPVDFTRHDAAYTLFSVFAAGAAALADPDVFRVFVRRMGLLDSTSVLDDDMPMQRRIEDVFATLRASPRPPAGPSREEMVALTAMRSSSPSSQS